LVYLVYELEKPQRRDVVAAAMQRAATGEPLREQPVA